MYMYVRMYMYACTCMHVHVCMYMYACTYKHVHVHVHAYTCIHGASTCKQIPLSNLPFNVLIDFTMTFVCVPTTDWHGEITMALSLCTVYY